MTEQDQYLIDEFKTRLRLLISKQNSIKNENKHLLDQVRNLQEELSNVRKDYALLVEKYENLKVAKVFIASEDEKQHAKQAITKIVREIDKCIAQLNV